mmetsp:Transcript_3501/g.2517  ORF Transcript_3501/g.2517 Transcript_3501/m.2517 type:complete len:114 (+) Transcript_3501:27-368(+)
MSTEKELGSKAFQEKDYHKAIEHFTRAIEETPSDHTLYSNRSACYYNLGKSNPALEDANKCIELKPDWSRGFQRKANALHQQGNFDYAIAVYEEGLKLDPSNSQISQGLEKCR